MANHARYNLPRVLLQLAPYRGKLKHADVAHLTSDSTHNVTSKTNYYDQDIDSMR